MEPRRRARLARARRSARLGHAAPRARPQPALRAASRRCTSGTRSPTRLPLGGRRRSAATRSSPSCATASEAMPPVLVVCNMTPVPRHDYRIGVPRPASGAKCSTPTPRSMVASDMGNGGSVATVPVQRHGEAQSLELDVPPLGDGDVPAATCRRGPRMQRLPDACCPAGHFRSARRGTGWASTSRSSRRTPNASTSACSTHPAGTRSPARRCRNTPTRSGMAICRRHGRACSTAIAPTAAMPRTMAIASTPTSC